MIRKSHFTNFLRDFARNKILLRSTLFVGIATTYGFTPMNAHAQTYQGEGSELVKCEMQIIGRSRSMRFTCSPTEAGVQFNVKAGSNQVARISVGLNGILHAIPSSLLKTGTNTAQGSRMLQPTRVMHGSGKLLAVSLDVSGKLSDGQFIKERIRFFAPSNEGFPIRPASSSSGGKGRLGTGGAAVLVNVDHSISAQITTLGAVNPYTTQPDKVVLRLGSRVVANASVNSGTTGFLNNSCMKTRIKHGEYDYRIHNPEDCAPGHEAACAEKEARKVIGEPVWLKPTQAECNAITADGAASYHSNVKSIGVKAFLNDVQVSQINNPQLIAFLLCVGGGSFNPNTCIQTNGQPQEAMGYIPIDERFDAETLELVYGNQISVKSLGVGDRGRGYDGVQVSSNLAGPVFVTLPK